MQRGGMESPVPVQHATALACPCARRSSRGAELIQIMAAAGAANDAGRQANPRVGPAAGAGLGDNV